MRKNKKTLNTIVPKLITILLAPAVISGFLFPEYCYPAISENEVTSTYESSITFESSSVEITSAVETTLPIHTTSKITTATTTIQPSTITASSPKDDQSDKELKMLLSRIKGKKINRYAFVKKKTKVYDIYHKPIKKIKKGTRCLVLKKVKDGYSMIKISNAIYYLKTKYLTYKCNKKSYVSSSDKLYTYSDMVYDIKCLNKNYGDIFTAEVVGKSLDNRDVYSLIIGNPNAKKTLFIESTIHAREYTNTQIIMKIIEDICRNYDSQKYYRTYLSKIFSKVKLVVMPMVNPDGVSISQYGATSIHDAKLRKKVVRIAKGKYSEWKGNARGVDLNRNYAQGFGYKSTKHPALSEYAGKRAYSEPEVVANVNNVQKYMPNAVICFHEAGQVIYYRYNSKLLNIVKRHTGYQPIREGEPGYGSSSDFLDSLGITNCTIENGLVPCPLSHWQFNSIYRKNKYIFIEAAKLYM